MAKLAVSDFHAQTWQDRELIVVNDPKDGTSLGALRQRGVEMAKGEFIAIWDDDDRSAPDRLAQQMNLLSDPMIGAVFLGHVTLSCRCGALVRSVSRIWECTMVCRKSAMPRYEDLPKAEDSALVKALKLQAVIGTIDAPDLYTKTWHGANTWDRRHNRRMFDVSGHSCLHLLGVAN